MNSRKNAECERKSKSIKEEVLKKIVVDSVNKKINHIINNKKLEEITMREYKNKTTTALDKAIKSLEEKLSKTEKAINSLYEDYTSRLIEEEDYRRFYKGEVEKRNTLKSEINNLLKQKEEKPTITKEELITIISKLSNIEEWTSEKLSELIYNIEINKENNIYINYRYDVIGKL
jgi:ribosomal protein L16 Arg81 hydroxylase